MSQAYWDKQVGRRDFVKSVAAASVMMATAGHAVERVSASLRRFDRGLIQTHFAEDNQFSPDFIGSVELDESFIIETANTNDANGPVHIEGVNAGDAITVEIEAIEIVGPVMAPNGGPLDGFGGFELEMRDGYLYFPEHFRIRPRPTLGNVAVMPSPKEIERLFEWAAGSGYTPKRWRQLVNDPRGKHCHQDCPFLGPNARIHMIAQVDGAGLCMADFHAYMGEGEMAFNGVSSSANVTVRVTRCADWPVDWPIIETPDEVMVVRTGRDYVQVVREAFRGCRDLVEQKTGCSTYLANSLVASAMDLRNSAIYGLGNGYFEDRPDEPSRDLSVVGVLPKDVFI